MEEILGLQAVEMKEADASRAIAMARAANEKARAAADARLEFEDEPAHYSGFLHAGA